jgi:hypothetical protein
MKPRENLVTVCGHNTTMLYHMLRHYQYNVKEIFVILYAHHEKDPVIEQGLHVLEQFNLKPHKIVYERPFDWARVTEHYNETKLLKPDEWWIVADDDELQLYSKPTYQIIDECEEFGYEFVTGGFVDRIGENGTFPIITNESNIWEEMPEAGFFRYPLSYACPNKVTLMKGNVKVSNGQHYVQLDDTKTTCQMEHPKKYPIEKNFTQVHHFKWDSSVLDRLQQVGKSSIGESWGEEYQLMYNEIEKNDFKIDLTKEEFMFQRLGNGHYHQLHTWNDLRKKIVTI